MKSGVIPEKQEKCLDRARELVQSQATAMLWGNFVARDAQGYPPTTYEDLADIYTGKSGPKEVHIVRNRFSRRIDALCIFGLLEKSKAKSPKGVGRPAYQFAVTDFSRIFFNLEIVPYFKR